MMMSGWALCCGWAACAACAAVGKLLAVDKLCKLLGARMATGCCVAMPAPKMHMKMRTSKSSRPRLCMYMYGGM